MPGESVYCFMYYFLKSKREKPEKVKKEVRPGNFSRKSLGLGLFTFFLNHKREASNIPLQ